MTAELRFLNPVDAAYLRMESPRTPMHVGGLLTFRLPDGAPRDYLRRLYEHLRAQPVTAAPFNQRLARGGLHKLAPAWETLDEVDIDHHFRHSALPFPGGERELGVLVARLHSHQLDLRRPPWEIHLIEGLEHRRFALYVKLHHSTLDGLSAINLLRRWLSEDAGALQTALWNLPGALPARDEGEDEAASLLRSSAAQLRAQFKAGAQLAAKLVQMSRPRDNPEGGIRSALATPRSMLNVRISAQRRLATQLFALPQIKSLAERAHCTVNDLALAICAGAVRRYLLELDALPAAPLVASVPVGLARPEAQAGKATRAGFVVPLSTQQSDPLQRLDVVRAVTQRMKEQLHTLSGDALRQFTLLGLSPLLVGQMTGVLARLPPVFNFQVSNVLLSRETLYLHGAPLDALYPVPLLFDGYALNITVVGYADRLAFAFTGCRDALPSLQKLAVYAADALGELEAAICGEPSAHANITPLRRSARRGARRVLGEDTGL